MAGMGKKRSSVEIARWLPLAAGVLGAAAGAALTMRRRAANWRSRSSSSSRAGLDVIEDWVIRFWLSHEALRRNLDHFIALVDHEQPFDSHAFGSFVDLYTRFLVVHHQSEDQVVFPTLRRHGRLRSTDAAHRDKWGAEQVNALAEALARAGRSSREGGRQALLEVRRLSEDLRALLEPHLSDEEALLMPSRLAEMVPSSAIDDMERESRKLFGGDRAIPLFFAHSLHADEQKQVFGTAPWVFRRVIFPLMDRQVFPRLRPFAISPSLAT